jgi:hypothetical protein
VLVARATELLEEHVQDVELKAIFRAALDDDDDDLLVQDSFCRRHGVLMGTFFITVKVSVQSWFTGPIAECAFGSSHSTLPFNEPRFTQILEMSDKGVDASKLIVLLIWAAMDGRISAKPRDNCI